MLWSPSGAGTEALADGAILVAEGAIEAVLSPRIATSAEELARENDCILIALPAYGHKSVMDALIPHVRAGQHVIISSHASLGAIYLRERLAAR